MALREVFAQFVFAFEGQGKLRQASAGVDSLTQKAKSGGGELAALGAGLVSAFAGNALLGGLNRFAEELDVLDDLSAQTKVATDDLQVYGFAAQKAGSSTAEMNGALSLLQKSLGKTTESTGAQVEALNKLKIDTSQPRELNEVLPEIFANFQNLKTGADKASVATSLFGRAGVRLIPLLEKGTDGIAELRAELEESGGLVSAETIARAGEYRDNLARLDRSMFALKGTIAGALFPQMSKLVEGISKGVGQLSNFAKGTTLADNAGIALAATLAGPVFSALRPFLGRGLKFAAIFGAVDDLLGFLEGKDSLIADMLNGAFGDGTADAVRDWVNDAVGQLGFLMSSHENAMSVIEAGSTSVWLKLAAGVRLFVADAISGFPIIRSGFALMWAGTVDDFNQYILQMERRWNLFLQSLVPAGPLGGLVQKVVNLAQVDTTDARRRVRDSENAREEAGIRASAATNNRSVEAQRAAEAAGDFGSKGLALAAETDSLGGAPRGGVFAAGRARVDRINAARADAQAGAAGLAPAQLQGTLAQAAAAGTTATLNDNKTVNLNFAKGTSAADKDAIKAAVAEALRTENRTALEALTQRAKVK